MRLDRHTDRRMNGQTDRHTDMTKLIVAFSIVRKQLRIRDENLGMEKWFVSPCIIIYSNKSTSQMHQSLRFTACRLNIAQHVSSILMPIIRSLSTAIAASGLPLERGGSSVFGRVRTDHDQQHCYHHVQTVNQRRLLQLISS
jgi:hypothetical protein